MTVLNRINFRYEIDENVVTIWNYSKEAESNDETDFGLNSFLTQLLHSAATLM